MKVLITGANGFLGYYLSQTLLSKNFTVIATAKGQCRLPIAHKNFVYEEMDFNHPFAYDIFEKHTPEFVVHAGAMTKPDDCEKNQWNAYLVNVEGCLHVLTNAAICKSHFILLSTDFVFDGERGNYKEEDERNPVNYYGKTKLEAEQAVEEYDFDWAIVRTALVYGRSISGRDNIVTLVRKKLENNEPYQVFTDQLRAPTYVEDVAGGICLIIEKKAKGVFHVAGEDVLTPYEIACEVADYLQLNRQLIIPVTKEILQQPAIRPTKTQLDIQKAKQLLGFQPTSFKDGLSKTFATAF